MTSSPPLDRYKSVALVAHSMGGLVTQRTLVDYPETDVIVKGHTDSVGSEQLNQDLSEKRADGVKRFLIAEGVAPYRVRSFGFGESLPVASNETAAGRQQNRRVEIELRPNDSLRERDAQQGGRTY